MKYTLATLALLGLVSVEEVNAMNLNHRHQHKHRHMKKDDDDKDEVKETAHPPKEVSEYTQDMVKADVKKNWYNDHAFNVTDLSYNSGDKKPTDHNNGYTNAQKKNSSKNSTVSLVQARYGPTTEQGEANYRDKFHGGIVLDGVKPSSHSWHNANGGGSEKTDDFWEMGHSSTSPEQFWGFTKKSKIGSLNTFDTEPLGHPMGINVVQRNSTLNATTSFAQASYGPTTEQGETNYRDKFHGGVVLDGVKPSSKCWGNCNGSGSEKQDDYWDMGHASTSPEQFWGFTKKSKIGSLNTFDSEPLGHPMGINVVQQRSKHHHKHHKKNHQRHLNTAQTGPNDYGTWWTNGNGDFSEKTDTFWDMGHISQTPEEFNHRASRDVWLRSENEGDAAPSGHNMGLAVAQKRTGPNDYGTWWTDGNGGTSEKTDTFWDMGHISQSPQEFDHRASRDVWLRSQNEVDATPAGHPAGINNVQTGYADYWKFLDYDSKDTEDFHDKASKPDLGSSNDNDKVPKTKYM